MQCPSLLDASSSALEFYPRDLICTPPVRRSSRIISDGAGYWGAYQLEVLSFPEPFLYKDGTSYIHTIY